jgi:hypothetical protein
MKLLTSAVPTKSARPYCRHCGATAALESCQSGGYQCLGSCIPLDVAKQTSHKGKICIFSQGLLVCQESICLRCEVYRVWRQGLKREVKK